MLLKCDGKGGCGKDFKVDKFEIEKLERDIELYRFIDKGLTKYDR